MYLSLPGIDRKHSDYKNAKNSLYSREHQRQIEVRDRQLNEIRQDWEELMQLVNKRRELAKRNPNDLVNLLKLDNQIYELAFEYANNQIYITI